MLTGEPVSQQQTTQRSVSLQEEQQAAKFTKVILPIPKIPGAIFQKMGRQYRAEAGALSRRHADRLRYRLVRYGDRSTARLIARVYIDLSFYDEMKNKLGADGDFAGLRDCSRGRHHAAAGIESSASALRNTRRRLKLACR